MLVQEHPPLKALLRNDELEVYARSLGVPMGQMDKHAFAEALGQQVVVLYELLGIKADNQMSQAARVQFATWFRTHYADLEVTELTLAFQLAFREKTTAHLDHYQAFSVPFVRQVMDAYLEYRKRAVAKASALHHAEAAWKSYVEEHVRKVREANHYGTIELLQMHWRAQFEPENHQLSRLVVWDCAEVLIWAYKTTRWRLSPEEVIGIREYIKGRLESDVRAKTSLTATEIARQIKALRDDTAAVRKRVDLQYLAHLFDYYRGSGRCFWCLVYDMYGDRVPVERPSYQEAIHSEPYRNWVRVFMQGKR